MTRDTRIVNIHPDKGDWYPDLVKVFYNNMKIIDGEIKSRVKGIDIYIEDFIWMLFIGLEVKGVFSHLGNSKYNQTLKKRDLSSSW